MCLVWPRLLYLSLNTDGQSGKQTNRQIPWIEATGGVVGQSYREIPTPRHLALYTQVYIYT
jgi:hypothetical protein